MQTHLQSSRGTYPWLLILTHGQSGCASAVPRRCRMYASTLVSACPSGAKRTADGGRGSRPCVRRTLMLEPSW